MGLQLKKAQRSKAYLKLGIASPSGGGKTLGALLIAFGLMREKYPQEPDEVLWDKICIIDTENMSGELYVDYTVKTTGFHVGNYNAVTLTAPFKADKYTQAIELCREAGMEVCIIDSTTHLWSGTGGLLEEQSSAAKRSGNSYTAWRDITPQHSKFVEAMLQTPMHIIATMRSKQEYVQEKNDQGKSTVKKLGMEPEQRKGMEYEFTTFFEIDAQHNTFGSKDRSSIFDQETFVISPEVGRKMMKWLMTGVTTVPEVVAETHKADSQTAVVAMKEEIIALCKSLGGSANDKLMKTVKKFAPTGNPNSLTDETKIAELRTALLAMQELETA